MAEADRLKTAATLETVRTGVPSRWRNPDTGNEYAVTATRIYEAMKRLRVPAVNTRSMQ